MAINFLDTVNFNGNSINNIRIQNVPTDPSTSVAAGDLIFNTSSNVLKYYDGTSPFNASGWISLTADTVLPTATSTAIGGVKLFSDTDQSITAEPVSATSGRTYGVQFNSSDQMVVNVPWLDTNTTEWILEGDTGNENIVASTKVKFVGGTNITTVASTGTGRELLTVNLDDSITLTGTLSAEGSGQSSFVGQVTIPTTPVATTDAASKAYVDASTVGNLIFQGGYNASTNNPDLDSSPSSSIKKGWSYVVTVAGTFFTEAVEVGDFLFAKSDAPTALADWVTVQNNIGLADISNVGIGNVIPSTDFGKEGIAVIYDAGTANVGVSITGLSAITSVADDDLFILSDTSTDNQNVKITASNLKTYMSSGASGVNLLLNSALEGVSKSTVNGVTTFTVDVTNEDNAFGSGVTAINVKTEVLTAAGETVYAGVTRSGTSLSIAFVGTIADSAYRVLLVNVA